ncbi:hypothetical protein ScPMuIL_014137 [Solemya velum]
MNTLIRNTFISRTPVTFCRLLAARYSADTGSKKHIDGLVKDKDVVVFMKGTPDSPRCGFSNGVVQILQFHGVEKFDSYDVLSDEKLREGIKEYSNWPTIPQVYMKGEFIGGCDILLDMHKNGDLIEELKKVGIKSKLLDHEQDARHLINAKSEAIGKVKTNQTAVVREDESADSLRNWMRYWDLDQHLPPKRLLKLPENEIKMVRQSAVILIVKDRVTRKQMTKAPEMMTKLERLTRTKETTKKEEKEKKAKQTE